MIRFSDPIALARDTEPRTPEALWRWLLHFTGFRIPRRAVCAGHHAPFDVLAEVVLRRPPEVVHLGNRGGGKSFGIGLAADLRSRFHARHSTLILGGSLAQSRQSYAAIEEAIEQGRGPLGWTAREAIEALGKQRTTYRNRSWIAILAASSKSVHGPHATDLYLDEIDELDPSLADAAVGMSKETSSEPGVIVKASTWHKPGGPMQRTMAAAKERGVPTFTSCLYESLQRCPESYSGPPTGGPDLYENCHACPLRPSCHEEVVGGLPRAKRAAGHYTIRNAIRATGVSPRVFASDYLCRGARALGLWFERFVGEPGVEGGNVSARAAYDPRLKLGLSVDSGVWTAAVFYQVAPGPELRILEAYLSENEGAARAAASLREIVRARYRDTLDICSTDPAGDARNPVGPKVGELFEAAGLKGGARILPGPAGRPGEGYAGGRLERWPRYPGCVSDQLDLVDALVLSESNVRRLIIHPSCRLVIDAFNNYRRKFVKLVVTAEPEQEHPWEDLMDAVRGACAIEFPRGIAAALPNPAPRHPASSVV